ncbi:hypothetical protein LCGC14_0441150 [marine sediment metagenome]|uniref:Uncharacterized protein n=1 Tax=marine sediment metagenome TaxID=412755 RepID=A0A0F9VUH9_9ZZZZ
MRLIPRWLWKLIRHKCCFRPSHLVKTFLGHRQFNQKQVGNTALMKCRCGMQTFRSLRPDQPDPYALYVNYVKTGRFRGKVMSV